MNNTEESFELQLKTVEWWAKKTNELIEKYHKCQSKSKKSAMLPMLKTTLDKLKSEKLAIQRLIDMN